jgi:ankyrin repeat protein
MKKVISKCLALAIIAIIGVFSIAHHALADAIHSAIRDGDLDRARLLISQGEDVNKMDGFGYSPLFYAARFGHLRIAEVLMNHGAKINIANSGKATALQIASATGHIRIVEFLIRRAADVGAKDSDGNTALHRAAQGGHAEVVSFLLSAGANIHAQEDWHGGATALHLAAEQGHIEVVTLLVTKGADVNSVDRDGRTPLYYASFPIVSLQEQLRGSYGVGYGIRGHANVVALLVQKGGRINSKSKSGVTALHNAAKSYNHEMTSFLLAHGAEVNARDDYGQTPLHMASGSLHTTEREAQLSVIRALLSHGADPMAFTDSGYSPIHRAALHGYAEVVELLLGIGVDANLSKKDRETPLAAALKGKALLSHSTPPLVGVNYVRTIELLRQSGAK